MSSWAPQRARAVGTKNELEIMMDLPMRHVSAASDIGRIDTARDKMEVMGMRLIDADAVVKDFYLNFGNVHDAISAKKIIDRQPTVDPVHAAGGCYCRECKHVIGSNLKGWYKCELTGGEVEDDNFCGRGEPREA